MRTNSHFLTFPFLLTHLGFDIFQILCMAQGRVAEDSLRGGSGWWSQKWMVADAGGVDSQNIGAGLGLVHTSNVVARTLLT